jgi:DNA-binding MarR family transcriptional regulator
MGVEAEDRLVVEASGLRALPSFDRAVRAYTLGVAKLREAPWLLNKLISHEVRFRVIGYLLYLHADRELFGPHGGATYGRLLETCQRREEVSPRVLKTVLALLQFAGFVEVRRDEQDRRVKLYKPTDRMFGFVRQWLDYAVRSLDVLQPQMRRTAMLGDDPGFIERFLVSGGRDHIDGGPVAGRMPKFVGFYGGREGASAVILAVMQSEFDGVPPPSRAVIARRFGVSKTQITKIVAEGVALGFFSIDPAGVPFSTAELREDYGRWISLELAFYARHMQPEPDV